MSIAELRLLLVKDLNKINNGVNGQYYPNEIDYEPYDIDESMLSEGSGFLKLWQYFSDDRWLISLPMFFVLSIINDVVFAPQKAGHPGYFDARSVFNLSEHGEHFCLEYKS